MCDGFLYVAADCICRFSARFAKAVPRTFQSGVDAIEIPVVAFRVIGDDIGMRLQPVGDDLHIVQVD